MKRTYPVVFRAAFQRVKACFLKNDQVCGKQGLHRAVPRSIACVSCSCSARTSNGFLGLFLTKCERFSDLECTSRQISSNCERWHYTTLRLTFSLKPNDSCLIDCRVTAKNGPFKVAARKRLGSCSAASAAETESLISSCSYTCNDPNNVSNSFQNFYTYMVVNITYE